MLSTSFLKLNVTRAPLDKPLVRKALALAIDRERIAQALSNGTEQPAGSFVPPGLTGYQPGRMPDPNSVWP